MKSQKVGFILLFAVALGYLLFQNFKGKQQVKNIPDQVTHILTFGDNLTLGNLAEPNRSYPSILEKLAGKPVENKGATNETTESALARLQAEGSHLKGELVIITLGAWDLMTRMPLSETLKNLAKIFEFFLEKGYLVVYGGFSVPPTGDNWLMAISQLCGEYKVLYAGDLTPIDWTYDAKGEFHFSPLKSEENERIANSIYEKIKRYL
ncbi:MAG: hypothetical protein HRU09_02460 [Oligoflexales bacterium]|nr:hypothetical protein [Oligoflexales bacterium]